MIEKDVNSEIKTVHLKRKSKTNFIKQSLVLLTLGFVLVSSFFSTASVVSAQAPLDCVTGQDIGGGQVLVDKSVVYPDEEFTIYSAFFAPGQCVNQVSNVYFGYVLRTGSSQVGEIQYRTAVGRTANGFFNGFEGGLKTTLKTMFPGIVEDKAAQFSLSVNVYQNGVREGNLNVGGKFINISMEPGSGTHDLNEEPVPPVPPGSVPLTQNADGWAPENLKTRITGIRTIYRSVKGDPTNIPYSIAWEGASVESHPNPNDTIKRGQDNYSDGGTYLGLYAGVNYQGVGPIICGNSTSAGLDWSCASGTIRDTESTQAGPPPLSGTVSMPWSVFDNEYDATPSTPEKTFTKGFIIFPILYIKNSNDTALAKTENRLGFVVEYYADDVARTAACVKEQVDVKKKTEEEAIAFCADPGNRAVGGEEVSGSFTSDDDGKDSGKATPIADFLADIIGDIIAWIQLLIYTIFGIVVLPIITTLISIPTYTDNFAAVILPGWELLRNLSNIFFILVLLVIGLGTLFRVQGYQYKNLLLKLIFAAFMVNFSLVLTQSFLAVAETAQFQFLPQGAEGEKVINVIANELMIAPLNQDKLTPDKASENLSQGLARLVFPFFYLSLTFMAFVVFVSLAFFLVLRMIVIWILLMASPIAIVATVIPQTKKYATMWLSSLVQYGFFVTILGFFLNVTAYLAQRQEGVLKALGSQGKEASFEEFLSRIATNIFVMGFLVAGLKVAGGMKVIGAGTLNKLATKAGKLPFDFLKFGGERLLEGAQNVTGVTVDPRLWKNDWDNYLKRRDKEKADRLMDRRTGEKGIVGKIPGLKKLKLGSPDDIFENTLTPKGWMKIVKTPKQFLDRNTSKYAEGATKIMTDEERRDALLALPDQKNRKVKLDGDIQNLSANGLVVSGTEAANSMSNALDGKLEELDARFEKLQEAKKVLASQGKSTAEVDAESQSVFDEMANIEKYRNALKNGGDLKIADMIKDTKNDGVKKELEDLTDDVEEKLTADRDGLAKEVDGFDKRMAADDKLRKKHTFSEYDPKGKAGDPNYKEFTEENKKMAHEVAGVYGDRADKYKFDPLYKTADEEKKKQAELRKKWEESGAETTDDFISIAQRAVRTGDKDVKLIMAEAFKKAAKEGGAADFMLAFAKENRGVSPQAMREFLQKDMKVIAGMDDKQILKLAFEIGKATSKAKQPNLSYLVQRTGDGLAWKSDKEQQNKAGEAYSKMSTTQFVQLDKSAMYNITVNPGGKEDFEFTEGAKKQWEAMDPSEAKTVISRMSRAEANRHKNAGNKPTYKTVTSASGVVSSVEDAINKKAG